ASDLNLYYDVRHPLWYKRPDWFAVVGVSAFYDNQDLRLSYVMWQEGVRPIVAIELLSPGTEDEDLGKTTSKVGEPPTKWQVYEQNLGIPYYFVFSRYTNELQAFQLIGGHYEEMASTQGHWPIQEVGLSLGIWQGSFKDSNRYWLRWFTLKGELIPEPIEEATEAKREAAKAKREANEAKRKAEQLAAKLRELGVNPDELE
ncbi:MAG: Uma2 family endonuclease, partial [Okeania sp. SIO2D1]|nr:Uma2 family endonuclease [Okeania sp. SIO2D1]